MSSSYINSFINVLKVVHKTSNINNLNFYSSIVMNGHVFCLHNTVSLTYGSCTIIHKKQSLSRFNMPRESSETKTNPSKRQNTNTWSEIHTSSKSVKSAGLVKFFNNADKLQPTLEWFLEP